METLKAEDISIDSLVYAKLLEETPDVILPRYGENAEASSRGKLEVGDQMGMAVEVMDTECAWRRLTC